MGALAGWHYLFIGTFILTAVLIPAALYVPTRRQPPGGAGFDLPGGILLGLAAGLFLFGITRGQISGFDSGGLLGQLRRIGTGCGRFRLAHKERSRAVRLPTLFKNRAYVAAVVVGYFSMLANVSALVFVPLLVSEANGLSGTGRARAHARSGGAGHYLAAGRAVVGQDRVLAQLGGTMLLSVLSISTFRARAARCRLAGMLGIGAGFALANSPTSTRPPRTDEVGVDLGILIGVLPGGGTGRPMV